MLIELSSEEIKAADRHARLGSKFPLLQAVVRQKQPGAVFAERRAEPNAFAIVTRFGFMGICGDSEDPRFDVGLLELLSTPGANTPSYLLWYAPPAHWQDRLDKAAGSVRRRERTRFRLNRDLADCLRRTESPQRGVEVRPLDAALLPTTAPLGLHLDSRFWSSAEQLLAEGVGACTMLNGEVVSVCYSACVVDGFAETDVATIPQHQGRGLASKAARLYIDNCIRKGIEPMWDCFTTNKMSMALAKSLGFEPQQTYPLYSFNVPLHFD